MTRTFEDSGPASGISPLPWKSLGNHRRAVVEKSDEELECVHKPRPGAVEHLVAVNDRDTTVPHRRQLREPRLCAQSTRFGARLCEREPAWSDDHELRL